MLFSPAEIPPCVLPALPGYSQHYDNSTGAHHIQMPHAKLLYLPTFYDKSSADQLQAALLANQAGLNLAAASPQQWSGLDLSSIQFSEIEWRHDKVKVFGQWHWQPRLSAWYGDPGIAYTYSGLHLEAKPWSPSLLAIKQRIETLTGYTFNSVLLNWYRDGKDNMGWHADDEQVLGPNPVIASLNLGATRRFKMRRNNPSSEQTEIALTHGSLLVMAGEMQHYWKHAVPKELKVQNSRINLTFRYIHF